MKLKKLKKKSRLHRLVNRILNLFGYHLAKNPRPYSIKIKVDPWEVLTKDHPGPGDGG